MPRHLLLLVIYVSMLAACDSGDPNRMSMEDYEGPEGEAVARHLIKTLPPISPEIPKVYTIVKGPHLKSTSMNFSRRFEDLKLTIVSGENLELRDPDKRIVDPRSDTSPVVLQISEIRPAGRDAWNVVAGWAWKKTFERRRYTLTKTATGYEMKEVERIEGNYVKPE